MKSDRLFHELLNIIEKLNIIVKEQKLRKSGINIKSGFCKIKGKDYFILDKELPINKKNEILSEFINRYEYDNIYIVPAVRDYLNKNKFDIG
ncbi:hypothetical protein [Desulfobacterium sp. N47]|uniref:Uncharacterized protein n=1 Tax=uncultured Desulfobacterium sp. TaxID=201089 RepID=E1YJ91_9BACT|nr:hypothetical protein N47_E48570 [uncultured Desulfobacterium sp.]